MIISFQHLLEYLDCVPSEREIIITIPGEQTWKVWAKDIRDILMTVRFEVPTLRKSLDLAEKDVATLQEQIAGKTLSFERPKWEYRDKIFEHFLNYEGVLNQMGREGWELVQLDYTMIRAIFKRMLNE